MNISRRNFIKAGAAGTTALGISGSLFSKKNGFKQRRLPKINLRKNWPTLTIQQTVGAGVPLNVQ